MTNLDFLIVGIYLVGLLACGAYFAKRAGQGADAYFLGDRKLPWWALGASGMSSNLDTAGTMTIVTMLYLFGAHGFFIEMRGGVVLPIAVFLAMMGKWHQRSQVMTTAEWMRLRFGDGFGGKAARSVAALTYLVITVGMVVFFLAASSPSDCQKIGMLWTCLFAIRWPMALGIALMGVHLGLGGDDPERLLPQALTSEFFPSGIRGLVIAALLAASMSTFDSTINAGASYVTRDLYLPFRPAASQRTQVKVGYIASALIVALGLTLSLFAVESVVNVWITIVIQLFPAFLAPFALRWFWGRFNGEGFSIGVVSAGAFWSQLPLFLRCGVTGRWVRRDGGAPASDGPSWASRPL